jgi:arylsulfatase
MSSVGNLSKPNIILIITDQMRGDCMSHVGHPAVSTPNLDELAGNGVSFTSAYSSCPTCIASRASLFTGLCPSAHGRLGYKDSIPWNYSNMLPEVLGDAGYQTHCVGKTHFFPQRKHCGFDSLDSYEAHQNFDGLYINDYYEWLNEKSIGQLHEYDHGLSGNSWEARPSHLPEELHNNSWVAAKGIDFLHRRDQTRPFFLNISFHRPHPPIDPPQVYYDLYKDEDLPPVPVGTWADKHAVKIESVDAWHGKLENRLLDRMRRAYFAQIAHIDNQIGRVLRYLNHNTIGPNIIIFTSDHGEMLGDHNLFRKGYAFEGSSRIPMIISQAGSVKSKLEESPVVIEDLYPTILDLAGIKPLSDIDGVSLFPFCGDTGFLSDRDYIHGEHSKIYDKNEAMQFLTDGREKYIWYTFSGQEQLFNLESDPNELKDLSFDPGSNGRLDFWRSRMIDHLAERKEDGLSNGEKLISGILLPAVRASLKI